MKTQKSKTLLIAIVALVLVVSVTVGITIHLNREAKRLADEYIAAFDLSEAKEEIKPTEKPAVIPVENEMPLVLKEYEYFESLGASYVVAILENTGDKIILYPQINAKVKDSSGALVGAGDGFGSRIYPGQTVAFSMYVCEAPVGAASVECAAMPVQDYALGDYPTAMYPEYQPMEIVNASVLSDRVVCEVVNPNNYNIDIFNVTVVFRDENGAICGGYTEYGTALPANASIGFEIFAWDSITYSSYELYASVG